MSSDIDLIETEKALVAQFIVVERVSVNAGAIALGHLGGASGTRRLVMLFYARKKKSLNLVCFPIIQ